MNQKPHAYVHLNQNVLVQSAIIYALIYNGKNQRTPNLVMNLTLINFTNLTLMHFCKLSLKKKLEVWH